MNAETMSFEEALTGFTPAPFAPRAWYNREGDTLEVVIAPDEEVEERVDDLVTVLRSAATNKIIGLTIKKLGAFLKEHQNLSFVFRSPELTFSALFTAVAVARSQNLGSQDRFRRLFGELPKGPEARFQIPQDMFPAF